MTKEKWVSVKGFEGRYEVSNLGRVKSLSRRAGNTITRERVLKTDKRLTVDGYARVSLRDGKRAHEFRLTRLVAEHFVPNPDNKETVNHKNGNKLDDRAENLEWMTREENMQHAYDNNLKKPMKGTLNANAKLTDDEVREIRRRYKRYCQKNGTVALSKEFGVTNRVIGLVVRGLSYKNVH